tara:strand:+ start:172 stop:339 length:168 start_codon:yes stop_codon:yes gene_type:complete
MTTKINTKHYITQEDKEYIKHLLINHIYEQQLDGSYYESEIQRTREMLTRLKLEL